MDGAPAGGAGPGRPRRGLTTRCFGSRRCESRAIGPPGDLAAWGEALAQVERAEDLIRQHDPGPDLREKVRQTRAELDRGRLAALDAADRLRRDRALLERLEEIRGTRADHEDKKKTDADYAAAFRDAGLDLDATDPVQAGAWIAAAERTGGAGLVPRRLGRRTPRERAPPAACRQPVAAARAADPDPWRNALRDMLLATSAAEVEAVRKLANNDNELAAQPADSLRLLALAPHIGWRPRDGGTAATDRLAEAAGRLLGELRPGGAREGGTAECHRRSTRGRRRRCGT